MDEYFKEQEVLAKNLVIDDQFNQPLKDLIAIDCAYDDDYQYLSLIHCKFPSCGDMVVHQFRHQPEFEYVAGLFYLREGIPIIKAIEQLDLKPDLLLLDGHGYCHPRKMGMASYIGLKLDIPSIGVAKKNFKADIPVVPVDTMEAEAMYQDRGQCGYVLRVQPEMNPIYISPGHRVSVGSSLSLVQQLPFSGKLPLPLAKAHDYSLKAREQAELVPLLV